MEEYYDKQTKFVVRYFIFLDTSSWNILCNNG